MKSGFERTDYVSRLLGVIILSGTLLRIFICFQHNSLDYLFSDPLRHWSNGHDLFRPGLMGASDPILYQVYIFLVQKITGENRYLVALSCAFLSVVMPWIFYRASREFGISKKISMLTWSLILWTPSLFTIYHYFMMETLLLPLMGLGLWMSGRYLRKGTMLAFLVVIVCWTLACLTKKTAIPLACICILYCWWKSQWRLSYVLAGGLLAGCLVLPGILRAYPELRYVAPFGNSWLTEILHRSGAKTIKIEVIHKGHWEFSSPSCYIQPWEPLSSWSIQRARENSTVLIKIDSRFGEQDWKKAYHDLKLDPQKWVNQLGENVILFLFAPSWPDGTREEWDGWLSHHSRWIWCPLVIGIIALNFRDFIQKRFGMLPLAITALTCFLMFQNLVTMEGRYRKPVEPLLILNLGYLISSRRKSSSDLKSEMDSSHRR